MPAAGGGGRPLRPPQDGCGEFSRERVRGYVQESGQRVRDHGGVLYALSPRSWAGKGRVACGLPGVPLLSGLFRSGDYNGLAIVGVSRKCDTK